MKLVVKMYLDQEKGHSIRYKPEANQLTIAMTSAYITKTSLVGKKPKKITITIEGD